MKNVKEIITDNNFSFKKKYGQNFITDENIINNIILKTDIQKNSLVIEVGPGAGSLTKKMCNYADQVLCYEIDETLKPILGEILEDKKNIDIIYDDFLNRNVKQDLKKYNYDHLYVVANLPYYITTPIIMKLIEEDLNLDKIVVMVQKEVGDRFKAVPGTKDYSSLSVFTSYYFNVKKIIDVSKNVFIPKPNVDSIVIEFSQKKERPILKNQELFFKLIRDSFKQKRKTLRNNLKSYDLEKIEETLKKYNFDLSVRAEQLSLEIFVDISNNL